MSFFQGKRSLQEDDLLSFLFEGLGFAVESHQKSAGTGDALVLDRQIVADYGATLSKLQQKANLLKNAPYAHRILICPSARLKRQAQKQGIDPRVELVEFNALPARFQALREVA